MSQERAETKSLDKLIAAGSGLPLELVLDIAQQVGEHLEKLHRDEAVHGGLNPACIALTADGTVQVLDAQPDQDAASGYHAPELRAGGAVSRQGDFYALGATLFEALTGAELGLDAQEIYPSNLKPGLPPELDELIAKCLQADPAKRVQSATELLNGIQKIYRGMKAGGQDTILGVEDALVGHTLGDYQLIERLGQGGMATVYKAYEPTLDRYVAIKVLPQFFASDPNFTQRFRREARAVAQLTHPNILPIYGFGEDGGVTYLVMQYVQAGTIQQPRNKALTPRRAVALILPITQALAYAHEQGIIHRDIKPANVLLAQDDWPLLADFGLAKIAEENTRLTGTGVSVGTPAYMAPEQGQGAEVDQRSDIYALGIMLYQLLTGEVPFRASTPMAVLIKHLTAPIVPPRSLNPAIPESLERVVLKATAKSPAHRYQSAQEMAAALESVQAEISEMTQPTPRPVPPSDSRPIATQPSGSDLIRLTMKTGQDFWVAQGLNKLLLIALPVFFLTCVGLSVFLRNRFQVRMNVLLPSATATAAALNASSMPLSATAATTALSVNVTPTDASSASPPSLATSTLTPSATALPVIHLGGGSGEIAFASNRGGEVQVYLFALEGSAPPRQITSLPGGACQPDWSPDGTQLVVISPCKGPAETYPDASLVLVNFEDDSTQTLSAAGVGAFDPVWSPDGGRIAFASLQGSRANIHLLTLESGVVSNLSDRLANDYQPAWSPDGGQLIFATTRLGKALLFTMTDRGEMVTQYSRHNAVTNNHPRWSPDGSTILQMQTGSNGVPTLVASAFVNQGYNEYVVNLAYAAPMRDPAYSPDGAWLTFSSNVDGVNHDIWVMTGPGEQPQVIASDPALDFDPVWRP